MSEPQSETPRTKYEASLGQTGLWVTTSFAETLERELSTEREARDTASQNLRMIADENKHLRAKLASMEQERDEALSERKTHKQTIDAVIVASKWDGCDGLAEFIEQIRIEKDEAQQWIDSDPDWKDKYNAQMVAVLADRARFEQCVESLTAQLDALRVERDEALRKLHEIDLETEGDVDGAPDRSAVSSLCNRIQNIILQSR